MPKLPNVKPAGKLMRPKKMDKKKMARKDHLFLFFIVCLIRLQHHVGVIRWLKTLRWLRYQEL